MRSIKLDETQDCSLIQQLAQRIWPIAFRSILSPEQISYMLEKMYSLTSLSKQMEEGVQFIIISKNGQTAGFCGYQLNYPQQGYVKVHKLYVLPEFHGSGLGKHLMEYVIEVALLSKCSTLTLNVNRFNPAVKFYLQMGLRIVRAEDINIGSGFLMEDYVMERSLM